MICKKHGKDTNIYCEEASCKKAMLLYVQKHHKNHDIVDCDNKEINTLVFKAWEGGNTLANAILYLDYYPKF